MVAPVLQVDDTRVDRLFAGQVALGRQSRLGHSAGGRLRADSCEEPTVSSGLFTSLLSDPLLTRVVGSSKGIARCMSKHRVVVLEIIAEQVTI